MTVATVADQVNDVIFAGLPAVISGQLHDVHDSLRVFAVHMKDRHHQHLGNIGRISGGARIFRKRCIADLIINHDMNGAAGFVAFQLRHIQSLSNDTLAGEGGIAVD